MTENELKIPWNGWHLVEKLGRGQFGSVYKISITKFGVTEYAAMKVISIPNDPLEIDNDYSYGYDKNSVAAKYKSYLDEVLKEYQVMMKIKGCPNVVRCDDIYVSPHADGIGWDVFIRMEYLTPILKTPVIQKMSYKSNETAVIKIGIDICRALIACEQEKILHRDIKPSNILLSQQGGYKLGDFGVSRTLENENTFGTKGIGTYDYMAPEVFNGGKYGKEADIYSLGMVMYWMLNEKTFPFLVKGRAPTGQEISSARQRRFGGETLPRPCNGSNELVSVVLKACAFNPKNRFITANEMLNALVKINVESKDEYTIRTQQPVQNVIQTSANQLKNTGSVWNDTQETVGKNYSFDRVKEENSATVGKNYSVPVNNSNKNVAVVPRVVVSTQPTAKPVVQNIATSTLVQKSNTRFRRETELLSVIGFVFSFLFPPAGLILSILGLINSGNKRKRGAGLAIVGIIVSFFMIISIFCYCVFAFFYQKNNESNNLTFIEKIESMDMVTFGRKYAVYNEKFNNFILEAKWWDYNDTMETPGIYSTDTETMSFSIQVNKDAQSEVYYAYYYSDDSVFDKNDLSEPIYSNKIVPIEYSDGLAFYNIDCSQSIKTGYYVVVVASDDSLKEPYVLAYAEVK